MPRRRLNSEEILQRLIPDTYSPPGFSLRWFLIISCVAPILVWLIHLNWAEIILAVLPEHPDPLPNKPASSPVCSEYVVLLLSLSMATGISTMALIRVVGRKHAKYAALTLATFCGFAVFIAVVMAILDGHGVRKLWVPDARDLYVIFATPLGVSMILGAIAGWLLAENE